MEIRNKSGVLLHEAKRFRDLSDLDLRDAVLEGFTLQGAHFDYTNLEGANLRGCDLYWASFLGANLAGADLQYAQLQGVDFTQANLAGTNLRAANLGRDNLGGPTRLQDVNLEETILEGANVDSAEYNEGTVFPKGFDPRKHKMTLRVPKPGRWVPET